MLGRILGVDINSNMINVYYCELPLQEHICKSNHLRVFFQKHWDLLKHVVVLAIKSIFVTVFLPNLMNDTHIAFLPKVQQSEIRIHLRPISLSKFTYKIISKVLVHKLKPLMSHLVLETGGNFNRTI